VVVDSLGQGEQGPGATAAVVAVEQVGEDEPVESSTIITTAANDLLRLVRDRMPVIVAPEDCAA
jgi:putative SOS response-associated peptidase YedK